MTETILIDNVTDEYDRLSCFFKNLGASEGIRWCSVQTRNNLIKLNLRKGNSISPILIEKCEITCVVQNELFRTIYVEGKRIMWNSVHEDQYSPSHSL